MAANDANESQRRAEKAGIKIPGRASSDGQHASHIFRPSSTGGRSEERAAAPAAASPAGSQPSLSPSEMAGVNAGAADTDRRTRPSSLSSTETDEDAVTKRPILTLASPSPSRAAAGHALEPPPKRRAPSRRSRPVRMFQSMCRSLPVLNPTCGGRQVMHPGGGAVASPAPSSEPYSLFTQLFASSPVGVSVGSSSSSSNHRRVTGTLFGHRDYRVSLALQANARCMPELVLELAIPTHALLRELGSTAGARIVLESEKKRAGDGEGGSRWRQQHHDDDASWVLQEPMWTMFCNGKRVGYAVRREPNDGDIEVLETLWAVSMGGGVLPGIADVDGPDGEMAYMRGSFDHTIGSRDSESLYMVGPPGGDCPELAIFFVRL